MPVKRTYCLARAVEADDNDGKLVLPVSQSIGISAGQEKCEHVANLVRYSWRPLRRWYIVARAG
jgi:hypothetical protein